MATVTAGRAAAPRVGVGDGAFQLDIAAISGGAAIGALGALSDISHTTAIAVCGLTLANAAAIAARGLVLVGQLEVSALPTRGVTGVATLAASLESEKSAGSKGGDFEGYVASVILNQDVV